MLPSPSNNGITGTWSPAVIDNMTSGTYDFTPDAGQCANPFTLNVTIDAPTDPTFTITDTYCAGDVVDALSSPSDNGITGTWSPTAIDNMTSGTYDFTPDAGQCANPFTLNVTITPLTVPTFSVASVYCVDDVPDVLPNLSDNGISGTWSPTVISTTTPGSLVYTFTPDAGGCNDVFSFTVTVNDCGCQNEATIAIDPVAPVCEDEVVSLNAVLGGSATTVTWTTGGDGSFNNINSTTPDYTLGVNDIANGSVTLTGTTDDPDGPGGPCLEAVANVVITINPLTTPTFTNPGPICQTEGTITLTSPSNEGITGTWSPSVIDLSLIHI